MTQQIMEPVLVVRGDVPKEMVEYARDKLLMVGANVAAPILGIELRIERYGDPARERPNHVEATVNLDGTYVRAHRSAPTMSEAIDRTLTRLRRRIDAAAARPQAHRLRHRDLESWHHDDRPTERPNFYPRPVEERGLVRRKTFALHAESIDEALFDLETLDHGFFLFVHDETGAEAVVHRVGEGYGLMQRVATPEAIARLDTPLAIGPAPATMMLADALVMLDESDARFVFFVDAQSGHGLVAYRRYDGDYGLILPG